MALPVPAETQDTAQETPTTPRLVSVPPGIQDRLSKGRARQARWRPIWAECLAFVEGRQFVFRSSSPTSATQSLIERATMEGSGAKPRYRARTTRNRLLGFYVSEVSLGTQRVPAYDVTPTTTDPMDINAARLSEKVLAYLYPYLSLRRELVEAYGYTVATGEGFIRPYWNATAGDALPADPSDPRQLFTGDISVEAYGPHEVYWEPGSTFQDSGWHAIARAKPKRDVMAMPGFLGGEVSADVRGNASFVQGALDKTAARADMVMVTEYLELPNPKNPKGMRLHIANNRLILKPEPYPVTLKGPRGPEPCLLKISFIPTPWRDRDQGLVEHLIDSQRTLNDVVNKMIEWKNLSIYPKLITGPAGLRDPWTAEPGTVTRSKVGASDVQWVTPPPMPEALTRMREDAIADMEEISSQRAIPPQIDSAKALSTWIERDAIRRQFITQGLADMHSKLGRLLLLLVQKYYTEPRMLQIAGPHGGFDYIPAFKGADLRDQVAVQVLPGSIEPRTRTAIEAKVMGFADRGWISPQQAMAAIDNGTAENLADDYELNVAKQEREIQQMIGLGDHRLPGAAVPIAKPFDDHPVHLDILHQWMLTKDFEESPPPVQEAATLHEQQHQQLEAQAQAQAQAQQMQTAQQLGMGNATRPPAKQMPDQPSISADQASGPGQ